MNQSTTDAPPAETLDSCRTTDIKGDGTKLILTYLLAIQDLASKAKMEVTPENLAYGKVASTQSVFAEISSICEAARAVVPGTEICQDVSASASKLASSEAQGSDTGKRLATIGSTKSSPIDLTIEEASSCRKDSSYKRKQPDSPSCPPEAKRFKDDGLRIWATGIRDGESKEATEYTWNVTGKGWMQIDDRTKYYCGQLDGKLSKSLSVMVQDVSFLHRFWLQYDVERNIWTGRDSKDDKLFMVGPKTLSRLVLEKATRSDYGRGFYDDRC